MTDRVGPNVADNHYVGLIIILLYFNLKLFKCSERSKNPIENPKWIIWLILAIVCQYTDKKTHFHSFLSHFVRVLTHYMAQMSQMIHSGFSVMHDCLSLTLCRFTSSVEICPRMMRVTVCCYFWARMSCGWQRLPYINGRKVISRGGTRFADFWIFIRFSIGFTLNFVNTSFQVLKALI